MSDAADIAAPALRLIEQLVGDTGAPERIIGAARGLAERSLTAIVKRVGDDVVAPVSIDIKAVGAGRIGDVRPEPGRYHAMSVASSAASADTMLMVMDADAIALLVGAYFGGDPDMAAAPIERELSPTELKIATVTFTNFALGLNGGGARSLNLRFPVAPAFTGAALQKHVLRDGPAARIDFVISTPGSSGMLRIVMPQRVLLEYCDRDVMPAASADADADAWGTMFGQEIMRSVVRLDALVSLQRMTLGQVSEFQPGQVLEIPRSAPSETQLLARDKVLFVGEFGKLGQNYTVRVSHPFDAGKDLMDKILGGG